MRGPIRRAIDDGHYNLGFVWDKLEVADKETLLHWTVTLSDFGTKAHMGMLPLVGLKTVFEMFHKLEGLGFDTLPNSNIRHWPKGQSAVDRIKTTIRFAVQDDLQRKKKLERKRAMERRTI